MMTSEMTGTGTTSIWPTVVDSVFGVVLGKGEELLPYVKLEGIEVDFSVKSAGLSVEFTAGTEVPFTCPLVPGGTVVSTNAERLYLEIIYQSNSALNI